MDKETVEPASKPQTETPHESTGKMVVAVGGLACVTLIMGSLVGSPWPAAVAACGICVMGLVAAWIMSRRG